LKNDETIKRKLCEFYYEDGSLIEQSRRSTHALADIMFTYPTVKMLEHHTGGKGKRYQYRFSKTSPEPFCGPPAEWFEGCGHGDELLFMFKAGEADLTEEDKDLSKKLIQ
jgi:carboxylesterase type B